MRPRWAALVGATAVCIAGCSSPTVHENVTRSTSAHRSPPARSPERPPRTTTQAPGNATVSGPGSPSCGVGTVAVTVNPGQTTPVCVHVGVTVEMSGGGGMSGGTWPGPARVSDEHVVSLVSSSSSGTEFTATFKAIGPGSTSVEVPFVAGPDVCDPTPCTPVPGAPLLLDVTVVP